MPTGLPWQTAQVKHMTTLYGPGEHEAKPIAKLPSQNNRQSQPVLFRGTWKNDSILPLARHRGANRLIWTELPNIAADSTTCARRRGVQLPELVKRERLGSLQMAARTPCDVKLCRCQRVDACSRGNRLNIPGPD